MKCICDMCNGTGYVKEASNSMDYPYVKKCPKCNGGGYKVEQWQTNKEWLQTASTEQLADFLHDIVIRVTQATWDGKKPDYPAYLYDWKKWLKQPHTPIS